jgi:Rad3-related DNA helicase
MSLDGEGLLHIIMPNPFVVLQRLFSNSKRVLLMSATPHSPGVLRDFFKVDTKFVRGETNQPGTLYLMRSQMKYVNHRAWSDESFRNEYYDAYRSIIRAVPKNEKTLIQSQSLKYSGLMAKEFGINVDSSQSDFYGNSEAFARWSKGDFNMLISTKCKRGIDLKDNLCKIGRAHV